MGKTKNKSYDFERVSRNMKKKNIASLILAFVLIIPLLNGCGSSDIASNSGSSSEDIISESNSSSSSSFWTDSNDEESTSNYNDGSVDTDNDRMDSESNGVTNESYFSLSDVPEYSGSPFVEINDNTPFFNEGDLTTEPRESYSDLDSLGRSGVAFVNVCKDTMPLFNRVPIFRIKPSGWHTVKYDNVDGKYLYNRCHLIGFQLAGNNDPENLITGTRYLNNTGMLPFENKIANYINDADDEDKDVHVLYRVTPIFDGNNLVASGVLMEAESVEDMGQSIHFNVFCYNVQPGIEIDYSTGDSKEVE